MFVGHAYGLLNDRLRRQYQPVGVFPITESPAELHFNNYRAAIQALGQTDNPHGFASCAQNWKGNSRLIEVSSAGG